MFATAIRRSVSESLPERLRNSSRKPVAAIYTSRFKPRKIWPPDFSKLSPKEQFRFEKKYKRRIRLATARPRWDKLVGIAQLLSVTGVLVYSVLFMDWKTEQQPFQGLRDRFWGAMEAFTPEKRNERRRVE